MSILDRSPGMPVTSTDVCQAALDVYGALFHRLGTIEPDAGFAEEYSCGVRWLEALAAATPWGIPLATFVEVGTVFGAARTAPDAEIVEWVCGFPRRFLAVIDRRAPGSSFPRRVAEGRRATDRVRIAPVLAAPRA